MKWIQTQWVQIKTRVKLVQNNQKVVWYFPYWGSFLWDRKVSAAHRWKVEVGTSLDEDAVEKPGRWLSALQSDPDQTGQDGTGEEAAGDLSESHVSGWSEAFWFELLLIESLRSFYYTLNSTSSYVNPTWIEKTFKHQRSKISHDMKHFFFLNEYFLKALILFIQKF